LTDHAGNRKTVNVTILDKHYQVACPPGEQVALTASARHLDEQMRSIRDTGKVVGLERIAVMAALNITNDMLQRSAEADAHGRYTDDAARRLHAKLDAALARFESDTDSSGNPRP